MLAAPEHIGQCALADPHPEHFVKHALQPCKGNRLKGLQIQNKGMQPGPKWRSIGHRRQSPFHTGSTLRAANMQPVVTTYKGGNRGQLNLVVFADYFALKIRIESRAALRANIWATIN